MARDNEGTECSLPWSLPRPGCSTFSNPRSLRPVAKSGRGLNLVEKDQVGEYLNKVDISGDLMGDIHEYHSNSALDYLQKVMAIGGCS